MVAWESIDAYLRGLGLRIAAPTPGDPLPGGARGPSHQTTGGTHVPTSLHYQGRARDYGSASGSDALGIARALIPLASGPSFKVAELFYTPAGIFFKNGRAITPDAKLAADHRDHVHVGLRSGVILSAAQSAAVGGLLVLVGLGILGWQVARIMGSR